MPLNRHKMKYLGINMTIYVQDLYFVNYTMLLRKRADFNE